MLYHISTQELNNVRLNPRIPKARFTSEDGHTPRICFSTTIEGCLNALPAYPNTQFFVYTPVEDKLKFKYPTKKQVPDVKLTNEVWVTIPVTLQKVAILKTGKLAKHVTNYSCNKLDETGIVSAITYQEYKVKYL
jgi:hypothetical protein